MKVFKIAGFVIIGYMAIAIAGAIWMIAFPKSYMKFVKWYTYRVFGT